MKKHNGMRPHDIVILLKIASKGTSEWMMKDLSYELGISSSEISESINRSVIAGLIMSDKKRLMKMALLEFLESGLRYVYPQQPGALVRGIKTAHSAPPLDKLIVSSEDYVWPYGEGVVRGQAIEPLHPKVPEACLKDAAFYELIAMCDVLRVGRAREKTIAMDELRKRIR
jgi:predicted transcriptional regulator